MINDNDFYCLFFEDKNTVHMCEKYFLSRHHISQKRFKMLQNSFTGLRLRLSQLEFPEFSRTTRAQTVTRNTDRLSLIL